MKKSLYLFILPILLNACMSVPESTSIIKPTFEPTAMVQATSTMQPTATIEYQVPGEPFPNECTGQAVWAHEVDNEGYFHFDVGAPKCPGFEKIPVLSPIDGTIIEVLDFGNWGKAFSIKTDLPIAEIDNFLISEGRNPKNVLFITFQYGHIDTDLIKGNKVKKGDVIGSLTDLKSNGHGTLKLAYVIRIPGSGKEYQYSPCEIFPGLSFCGKCSTGTNNPCP